MNDVVPACSFSNAEGKNDHHKERTTSMNLNLTVTLLHAASCTHSDLALIPMLNNENWHSSHRHLSGSTRSCGKSPVGQTIELKFSMKPAAVPLRSDPPSTTRASTSAGGVLMQPFQRLHTEMHGSLFKIVIYAIVKIRVPNECPNLELIMRVL